MTETLANSGAPRRRFAIWPLALGVAAAVWLAFFGQKNYDKLSRHISAMHTTGEIIIIPHPGLATPPEEAAAKATAAIAEVERLMSRFDPKSDIGRLNAAPPGQLVEVNPLTWRVLMESLRINKLTGGAFDVTVLPILKLYKFNDDTADKLPEAEQLRAALALIGSGRLLCEREGMRLGLPAAGMGVDLSAIAKGFAVDRAVEALAACGVRNALVELGGEVRAIGKVPEEDAAGSSQQIGSVGGEKQRDWNVGIDHPRSPRTAYLDFISASDCAIATSGDYQNYFTYQGEIYSHIVDPRTGLPVKGGVVSSTVIHPDSCMIADALATSFCVLGEEGTRNFLEEFRDSPGPLQVGRLKVILGVIGADGKLSEVKLGDFKE